MSADTLLQLLDKVRPTGHNSWVACCPAHNDKSPSLAVTENDEGAILAHCFAGCSIDDVLGAVGLTINDLFPERPQRNRKSQRRSFPAADVLDLITQEAALVAVAACNVSQGIQLSSEDKQRLLLAAERIHEARRLANGERT